MDHPLTRRTIVKGLGLATLAAGLDSFSGSASAETKVNVDKTLDSGGGGAYALPPLPYGYDALEPVIDSRTLELHHGKHHAGYVKKFNLALDMLIEARDKDDFSMITHWSRETAFHGSGHILHCLYWKSMSPKPEKKTANALLKAIKTDFGGLKPLRKQFEAAAGAVEGSGWCVLALEPVGRRLIVLQVEKHQDLVVWGAVPLLVCDVWEHAYYLAYQNRRAEYVEKFMTIVDWPEVGRRYEKAVKLSSPV
ncbi:MAG: superoxide dismutase [Pseudomonadota bacterium]